MGDGIDVGRGLFGHDVPVHDGPHGVVGACRAVALYAPGEGDDFALGPGFAIAACACGGVVQAWVGLLIALAGLQVCAHGGGAQGRYGELRWGDAAHGPGDVQGTTLHGGGPADRVGDALAGADDVALFE